MDNLWMFLNTIGGIEIIIPAVVSIIVTIITVKATGKNTKFISEKEVSNDKSKRYYEYQFELYNKLWAELYELDILADILWNKANKVNLHKFVKQLKIVKLEVKKNSLLIEDEHLRALINLIEKFTDYEMGKGKLIDIRCENYFIQDINNLVNNNKIYKKQYTELINAMLETFREHLKC